MQEHLLAQLLQQGIVSPATVEKIQDFTARKPFSLHWELKSLLYLGVLLLNAGLGYLIYENIDHAGHAVLIGLIALLSAACFWYVFRHRLPFSWDQVINPTPYFDYLLLLGCLLFLLLEGYLQYQYQIFGTKYGLATFLPMVLFFGLAYRFDHRGVLSLAVTALASWLGLTLTPQYLLAKNDFNSQTIINIGIGLSALLATLTFVGERWNWKRHFSLTYLNFGVHLGMISGLAGMMALDLPQIYIPLFCMVMAFFLWYAVARASFYFLVVAVIYGYIGITYLIFSAAIADSVEFYLLYFFFSCGGVILFFLNYKRLSSAKKED